MHLHMCACNKGKLFYQSSVISKGSCMRDSKIETDRKACQGYGACIEMCLESRFNPLKLMGNLQSDQEKESRKEAK